MAVREGRAKTQYDGKMAKSDTIIITVPGAKNKKITAWFFFGILAFIVVLFPLFMSHLRYQTSAYSDRAFASLGTIMMSIGGIMFVLGLVSLLINPRGGRSIKTMAMGFTLFYIGMFLITPTVGFGPNAEPVQTGYG